MKTTRNVVRSMALLLALVVSVQTEATANSGGKTGLSIAGCGGCHGGASANTNVNLEGPRTVKSGSNNTFTFIVGHGLLRNAGFNASFRGTTGTVGTLSAGPNSQVRGGELTHTQTTPFDGATARFSFQWIAPAAHGIYNFTGVGNAVNDDGNSSDADDWALTGNINITVTGATLTKPATGASFCTGSRMDIEWTQTGLGLVRIEMSRDNFATTEVINTVAGSALSTVYEIPAGVPAGNYVIRMVDATTDEEIVRGGTVVIQAGPNIVLQPLPTFVCAGKSLTLTISASGTNATYRWRRNGVDIPGGTNPVLTINQVTQAEAGLYQCVVFACSTSAASDAVEVKIGDRPQITRQPTARAVCEGDSVSFSIDATGSDIRYQWLRNGAVMPDDTLSVLRIARASVLDEASYSCRVEGACTPSVTSAEAKLDVTELPQIKNHPTDKALREGDTLLLTVETSGERLSYQWLKNGAVIDGAKDRTLRLLNVVRSDSGFYKCMVSNSCDTIESKSAFVRITPLAGPGKLALSSPTISMGPIIACTTIDTTFKGLLINEGGSPITITSISADPLATIEVVELRAPVSMAVNERRDLRVRISPNAPGPFEATVTFFTSNGSQKLVITGDGVPALQFPQDTLVYPRGKVGVRLCNQSLPLPCAATKITGVRMSGSASMTWSFTPFPDTPITLKSGETFSVCIESTQEEGDEALVSLSTDFGLVTFYVVRRDVTGVEDDETVAGFAAIRVYPNPAAGEVTIKGRTDETLNVSIHALTGEVVHVMSGAHEVRWDRRDASGALVPSGLYVLSIDGSSSGRTVTKLVLQ